MIRKQLSFLLIFTGILSLVNAGYITYKKPPKYWYYKHQPPLYVYTKPKYHHHHHHHYQHRPNLSKEEYQLYRLAAIYKKPLKYTKLPHHHSNDDPLDKFRPDKNALLQHGWQAKPVHGFGLYDHHPQQILAPHREQEEDADGGIKPVTEHIEDDLKYDFRTKTHSYR